MRFTILARLAAFCYRRAMFARDLHTFDVWLKRSQAIQAKLYNN